MKDPDPAVDRYAETYVQDVLASAELVVPRPWKRLKVEYDSIYHEVWVWILVASIDDLFAAYEAFRNRTRIVDIDETKCEVNMTFFVEDEKGRFGYAVDLSGKQDILDFEFKDVNEDDVVFTDELNLRINQIFQ